MNLIVAITLALISSGAAAHKVTTTFPEGATTLTAEALKSAIGGRVFTAQPAEGPRWQLSYRQTGEFSVQAGEFADQGRWTTDGSAICTQGQKLKYLCNDVRLKDGQLFLQRRGGEVMRLSPA